MRVTSDLADLQIKLGPIHRDGDELVIDSAPGSSLDTRIRVDPADAGSMLGRLLGSGAVWAFVIRLPFTSRKRRRQEGSQEGAQGANDNPAWRGRRESTGLNKPW